RLSLRNFDAWFSPERLVFWAAVLAAARWNKKRRQGGRRRKKVPAIKGTSFLPEPATMCPRLRSAAWEFAAAHNILYKE
ncbi:hypothetical protein, partial [Bacillus licheniformis]|uniref:hypothetical protein n=1 Tax=Bacillus licheniformis TaxID=1402 RepID=UPI00203DA85A